MAVTTKLELQQLLNVANAERESLRVRVAELQGTVGALKAQLEAAKAHGALRQGQRVRPVYEPSPEQLARRAAMQAAKDQAMRSGCVVKV